MSAASISRASGSTFSASLHTGTTTEKSTLMQPPRLVSMQRIARHAEQSLEFHRHLLLQRFERRGLQRSRHLARRAHGDHDARRTATATRTCPTGTTWRGSRIRHGQDRPLRHLRQQDGAGLEDEPRTFRPIGRDGWRDALLHQRVVVVAQRACAGVRGRTADRMATEVRHHHHADVAIDRGADEEA